MLVAGTALSLIAPIGAQASDLNIEGMNSYGRSKSSSKKQKKFNSQIFSNKLATLEDSVDTLDKNSEFEAAGFNSTTTLDAKAIMWVGAIDGINEVDDDTDGSLADEPKETTQMGYTFTTNINTSFNGSDNLYVRLKGGDAGDAWKSKPSTYHIATKDTNDEFRIDKIWYTFNIGNLTAYLGPKIENYYMYVTPSVYKPGALKAFKLGGNSNFGASTDTGIGLKYETESGFAIATNVVDKSGNSTGFLDDNDNVNKWDTQIAFTQPRYHVSITRSDAQNWTSQQYNATAFGEDTATDSVGYAFRAYWLPEESGSFVPEISIGYDIKDFEDGSTGDASEADSYMLGLTWKDMIQPDDKIGFAITQPLKVTEVVGGGDFSEVDPILWELYYSFKPNDSISITPAIFGGTDVWQEGDDLFGAVVTSAFKF